MPQPIHSRSRGHTRTSIVQCSPSSAIHARTISRAFLSRYATGGIVNSAGWLRMLALDHLGHFKKVSIRFGRILECGIVRQRGTQLIRPRGVGETLASRLVGINAEFIRGLRHGRNVAGIELV